MFKSHNDVTPRPMVTLLPDIADLVVDYLLQDFRQQAGFDYKAWRRQNSRLSLTCRLWSRTLRPLLFHQLTLRQRPDLSFLSELLHSPVSSWLLPYIKAINFDFSDRSDYGFQLSPPIWKRVLRSLPAVQVLNVWSHRDYFAFFRQDAAFFSAISMVRYLHLRGCHFPSHSALLRILGSMPSLECVDLQNVTWGPRAAGSRTILEAPSCPATFPNLKYVISDRLPTDNRSLAWIFAAAGARYELGWRPGHANPIPRVVLTIMELINLFWRNPDYVMFTGFQESEDSYIFCAHGGPGAGIPLSTVFVTSRVSSQEGKELEWPWVLDKLAIGINATNATSRLRMQNWDWAAINTLLSRTPHLQALEFFYGADVDGTIENFVETIESRLPDVIAETQGWYDPQVADGRTLALDLFGDEWDHGWFHEYYQSMIYA